MYTKSEQIYDYMKWKYETGVWHKTGTEMQCIPIIIE